MPSADELPKTCKAATFSNPGPNFKLEVTDVEVPKPGPDEILLKLNATGLCHSDIHFMMADWEGLAPQVNIAGHEGAGVCVAVGENVKDWKVGDRGGIKPVNNICRTCDNCRVDLETHCPQAAFPGFNAMGSYTQYVCSPAHYTQRIPDGVDDFVAGPIMCSGGTAYRSLRLSGLQMGQWCCFPGGGGGVGHMALQIGKAMGLRCIVIDAGDEKAELSKKLGAEHYVDLTKTKDVAAEVMKITGSGAHGVVVTASHPSAYVTAPSLLRVGGIVMCIALPTSDETVVGTSPAGFVFKQLTVKGTLVGSYDDTAKALDLAARGLLKPVYQKFSLNDLPKAVELLRKGKIAGRAVVDLNDYKSE
ncbi:GroES-like protein [Saitoella complicata NRRL Y-17804]|uniref:Enoyl reductase (ER) domain-containing protein n=1 Tax=Saitoella complicata (strain BCRC 22490 / CBS 7301 / JCM 7358 / NBRC 10748 / NRRL Y-17804) TaxID=698492 RepID=A0A0E9NAN4_SAICN|nr:GroES-like protein [Saitoella complicata NRRL Y-17804]ODQ53860.1 GroES-like protein [Saitoella complicata NRRL Y-17804]GAO46932.1 hypothetical protein G7K_1150-t1 [Saitoella complicata NRRL Y-17804]